MAQTKNRRVASGGARSAAFADRAPHFPSLADCTKNPLKFCAFCTLTFAPKRGILKPSNETEDTIYEERTFHLHYHPQGRHHC